MERKLMGFKFSPWELETLDALCVLLTTMFPHGLLDGKINRSTVVRYAVNTLYSQTLKNAEEQKKKQEKPKRKRK
jgi:hypothetical protein